MGWFYLLLASGISPAFCAYCFFLLLSFLCGYIHIGVVGLVLFTLLTLLICVTNASTNPPLHPLTLCTVPLVLVSATIITLERFCILVFCFLGLSMLCI